MSEPSAALVFASDCRENAPHVIWVKEDLSDTVTVILRDGARHSGSCLGEAVAATLTYVWST